MDVVVLFLHLLGLAVLLGTGAGVAFFLASAHRTRNPHLIAHVASSAVSANTIFISTAFAAQPLTGMMIVSAAGWSPTEPWIVGSVALYVIAGLLWLIVASIQIRLRDIAERCAAYDRPLTDAYFLLYRRCVLCGVPALFAIAAILWLTVNRPAIT
jgi:uncharacterized membrane protein